VPTGVRYVYNTKGNKNIEEEEALEFEAFGVLLWCTIINPILAG
jgi:hypothetical protein